MDNFIDEAYEEFVDWVEAEVLADREGHHLQFEIRIAWDDEDEFEHEGYYDSVDMAIEALENYKNYPDARY